jgi:hypothetical protein
MVVGWGWLGVSDHDFPDRLTSTIAVISSREVSASNGKTEIISRAKESRYHRHFLYLLFSKSSIVEPVLRPHYQLLTIPWNHTWPESIDPSSLSLRDLLTREPPGHVCVEGISPANKVYPLVCRDGSLRQCLFCKWVGVKKGVGLGEVAGAGQAPCLS